MSPFNASSLPPWVSEWITLAAVSLFLALAAHHFFLQGDQNDAKRAAIGDGQTLGIGRSLDSQNSGADKVFDSSRSSKDILLELREAHASSPPSPPPSDAAGGSKVVVDIKTADQWEQALLLSSKTSRPVVVKFTATWCKPCHAIDPFYVSLSVKYDATFFRIDVDDFDEIAADCSVSSMPTFAVLVGNKMMGSVSGISEEAVETLVKTHCALSQQHGGEKNEMKHLKSVHDESKKAPSTEEVFKSKSSQVDVFATGNAYSEHAQSSADHPGLGSFHKWHSGVCEKFRSYSIATSSSGPPPVPDSKRTRSPLRLLVTNATSSPIEACKIDSEGNEILVGNIGKGRTMREPGALGQPWAFHQKDGEGRDTVLMYFVPHKALDQKDGKAAKDGVGLYKFHIMPSGHAAKQEGRLVDINDPNFPFPSTKVSSVTKAVSWCVRHMEQEWADAASKTAYYRAPRTVLKYLRNVARAPSEVKYRRIRMENAVFQADVWNTAGKGILLALGFEERGDFIEMGGSDILKDERLEEVTDAVAQLEAFVCGKADYTEAEGAEKEPRTSVSEGIQGLFAGLEDNMLLQNGPRGEQERVPLGDVLAGKDLVLLYASAHWCPPCRRFTPQLIQFYNMTQQSGAPNDLEIVFLSADREVGAFQSYFASMPWLAVPYESAARQGIMNNIQVRGIPRLCVFDGRTGRILEDNAVGMPLDIERWRALLRDAP